jgi:peptidoglycan/LPS O-acetylase OafA/YrhL
LPRRRSATLAWPAGRLAGHGTDKARPDLWLRRSLLAHRSAHPASQLRCWSPLWTSPAALGLFTVALACISSIALNDQVFNFARYLSVPVPALLLVAAAIWLWPRRATGWARWPASSSWSAWLCSPWATPWRPLASGAGLERLRAVRGNQPKPGPDPRARSPRQYAEGAIGGRGRLASHRQCGTRER